jgi:hypothetical protein
MTDKHVIKVIHSVLQCRNKWYLDHSITEDEPILQDIVERAKEYADATLSSLSTFALYQRYKTWRKSEPLVLDGDKYFHVFLSDLAYDLGRKVLKGEDRLMYEDSCYLTFNLLEL